MPIPKKKQPIDLGSLARSYTELALRTLAGIAISSENDSARVGACAILLDRGWGRAAQMHTGPDGAGLEITIRQIIEDRSNAATVIEGRSHDATP